MTAFDRVERHLPELFEELAGAGTPDYFDDMLRSTTQVRQRPAWSSLERWLPMSVIARTRPISSIPLRPVLVLLLVAIVAAATVLVVGSQRRLPAPFGPARNGLILFESAEGGIRSYDPSTGSTTKLEPAPGLAAAPWFTNDGTRFAFDQSATASDGTRALYIANADGSEARQLAGPAAPIKWVDWSPSGDRLFVMRSGDKIGVITVIDTKTGVNSTLTAGHWVTAFAARPGTNQLIVAAENSTFYRIADDGTDLGPIVTADGMLGDQFSVSPDGRSLVYPTWSSSAQGRLHVVDIDTGVEQDRDFYGARTYTDLLPVFSPDSRSLLVERYDEAGYRPTIVPLDGGAPIFLGEHHPDMTDGALKEFSPDGSQVLVVYRDDHTAWLYDVASGTGKKVDLPIAADSLPTWQRLAP